MLTHHIGRAALTLTLITVGLALWVGATALSIPLLSQARRITPITDPTQLPRLAFEQLRYAGAFRLPGGEINGDTFAAGGGPIAFNPSRNSLFVGARSGRVAEITIPPAITSSEVASLPEAEFLQGFAEPSEGAIGKIAKDAGLSGLLVYGERLYGTGLIYYDAVNAQRRSHFSRSLSLGQPSATPLRAVWDDHRTGYVAGYLAVVPPEWQTRLGAPAVTGQCCVPITSRTSQGPAAFAFDPAALADDDDTIDARPLVYYPTDRAELGPWSGSNPTYGATTEVAGLALIAGTRTALFVGRNGTGPYCYGEATGDRTLDQTTDKKGVKFCYDPANASKGPHAYPYRYQMWAYDLSEWAEARAGRREPWSIKPYAVWGFELPTPETSVRLLGVAYDPATQRLFISQRSADRVSIASRALIHVYQLP